MNDSVLHGTEDVKMNKSFANSLDLFGINLDYHQHYFSCQQQLKLKTFMFSSLNFLAFFSLLTCIPRFLKPVSFSFSESFIVLNFTLDQQFASFYKTSLDTDKGIWKTGRIHLALREKILNVTLRSLLINGFLFCINRSSIF